MSDKILWKKGGFALIEENNSYSFGFFYDGGYESVYDVALAYKDFFDEYEKLKAVAEAARKITFDKAGNWDMHSIADLEKGLKELDK